jgi:hypothetical protein
MVSEVRCYVRSSEFNGSLLFAQMDIFLVQAWGSYYMMVTEFDDGLAYSL